MILHGRKTVALKLNTNKNTLNRNKLQVGKMASFRAFKRLFFKRSFFAQGTLAVLCTASTVAYSQEVLVESRLSVDTRGVHTESREALAQSSPVQAQSTEQKVKTRTTHERSAGGSGQYGAQTELFFQLEQLQEEVQALRGMVEELNYRLNMKQKQDRDRYLDLDRRINELTRAPRHAPPLGMRLPLAPAGQTEKTHTADLESQKASYRQATQLVRDKKFDQAIKGFSGIISNTPDSIYVPYSHYWLGEVYMARGKPDYEKAREHFQIVINFHSGHAKVPAALFKLGKLLHLTGSNGEARDKLNMLVSKYPENPAAQLAKDYLTKIQ